MVGQTENEIAISKVYYVNKKKNRITIEIPKYDSQISSNPFKSFGAQILEDV